MINEEFVQQHHRYLLFICEDDEEKQREKIKEKRKRSSSGNRVVYSRFVPNWLIIQFVANLFFLIRPLHK
jgi:hypothetical protein